MIPLPWYDTTSDTPHDQYDPFGAGYDVQPQQSDHSQQWDYAQQSDYSQQPDFSQLSSAPHDPVAFAVRGRSRCTCAIAHSSTKSDVFKHFSGELYRLE